jgi:hypothetical protein
VRMPLPELIEGLARQMPNVPPQGFPVTAFRPVGHLLSEGVIEHIRDQARTVSVLLRRLIPYVTKEHVECARAYREMHADDGDQDALVRFTTTSVRLPPLYMPWVARALWDSDWRYKDNPYAYLRDVAIKRYRKDSDEEPLLLKTERFVSLDVATNPVESVLTGFDDRLVEHEIALDLAHAGKEANLSPDQLRLIDARCRGYTRREVGAYLGWDQRKVEAEWRALTRAYPKLRNWLT